MVLLVWDMRLDVPSASRAMKRTLEISSGLESDMAVVGSPGRRRLIGEKERERRRDE